MRGLNSLLAVLVAVSLGMADGLIESRNSPRLRAVRRDARTSGINSIDELPEFASREWLTRRFVSLRQYVALSPQCQIGSIGIVIGCAPQLLYLSSSFGRAIGGELFPPNLTEDLLTREFLEAMPLPPTYLCCRMARLFQNNICGCDTNTLLSYRNMGFFDPLQTIKFADFLYGEQCGATVVLGERCPGGNPFDLIGNDK
ncbi:hypothetical protein BSKO_12567 [Bryopsis sp. KO-2023]|nr:hypothetical protein BSKO_12567 [Bryopsis sp. KO-2023]